LHGNGREWERKKPFPHISSWNPAIEATARIRLAYVIDRFSKTDRQTGHRARMQTSAGGGTYNNVAYRSHANTNV